MYPKTAILFLLAMLLAACSSPPPLPDTAPTVRPTVTNQPEATPKLSGPETTPIVPRPYPAALTVETAQQGIAAVVDAPPSITGLADVQAIIAKHTQLARDVGLSFDHMAVKYMSGEQRWFLVPVASDGTTIAGWLEIADASSLSGWRYGEQPTWDSQYHPSTDTYQYGLPALHDPANHFEVGFANGFPILIEVTSSGAPQYWNNIAQKTTLLVEGAVLPTETPTPEATQIPFESGPSLEFSPLFPAEWHKEWTGKVADMDIPIIIGLSDGVVYDKTPPLTPIYGVWMTQEGTDAVADAFLRAAHYRYTKIMGNDITYENYLELLKQPTGGEVNLLIMDNDGVTRREAMIDPRQGFSLLITDKIDPKLGVKFNRVEKVFFGVDGQGRLLFASGHFSEFEHYQDYIQFGVHTKDYTFVYNNIGEVLFFGHIENKCLVNGNVVSTCGEQKSPDEERDWWQTLFNREKEMIANGNLTLDFGLVRP